MGTATIRASFRTDNGTYNLLSDGTVEVDVGFRSERVGLSDDISSLDLGYATVGEMLRAKYRSGEMVLPAAVPTGPATAADASHPDPAWGGVQPPADEPSPTMTDGDVERYQADARATKVWTAGILGAE